MAGGPLLSSGFFHGELLGSGTLSPKAIPVSIDQLRFALGGYERSTRSGLGGGFRSPYFAGLPFALGLDRELGGGGLLPIVHDF